MGKALKWDYAKEERYMEWEQLVVGGFVFPNRQEAAIAENEVKKIEQLEEKLNYNNLDAVAMIYVKSIQNELFHTVIGCSYLKKLQTYLVQQQYDKIDFGKYPIPIPVSNGKLQEESRTDKGLKVRVNHQKELKDKLRKSHFLNIILLALVGALFAIALTAENANILNYRYHIQNEYSQWEQELQEREAAVREKERELQISE